MILFENTLINTHKIIFTRIGTIGDHFMLVVQFGDNGGLVSIGDYPTEDEAIAKLKELFAIIVHKEIADSMDAKIKPPKLLL